MNDRADRAVRDREETCFVMLNTCDLARQRPYHLLDRSAGFDELFDLDPRQRAADFRGVRFGQVHDAFTGLQNVNIHKDCSRRRCQEWKSVSTALFIWTATYTGLRRNCWSISGVEYLPGGLRRDSRLWAAARRCARRPRLNGVQGRTRAILSPGWGRIFAGCCPK